MALLLAGTMWFYVQHVMIPHQISEAALRGVPRGNLSDLYPRWLGTRELLLHGRDPYSSELTREIQAGYYGRALDPTRPNDPRDQQGFAYPVYVVFLLAPTITLPFVTVQTGFRWLLIALTALSVPIWLLVLRRRPAVWTVASIVALVIGSFQCMQGVKLQQLSLLVSALIAGSALLLVEDHLVAAGTILALATIKPQLALPFAAWLLLWAAANWRRRKNFVWGFVGTMFVLIAAGEFLSPGWIGRFVRALVAYRGYNNGAESTLEALFTPAWGRLLSIAIVLAIAIVCWRARRISNHLPAFGWIIGLILAATVVIAPKEAPYNQILLLGPALLIAGNLPILWAKSFPVRISLGVAGLIVFWPWLAAIGIAVAAVFMPAAGLQKAWALPLYTSRMIPLAVFAIVAFGFAELRQKLAIDLGSR